MVEQTGHCESKSGYFWQDALAIDFTSAIPLRYQWSLVLATKNPRTQEILQATDEPHLLWSQSDPSNPHQMIKQQRAKVLEQSDREELALKLLDGGEDVWHCGFLLVRGLKRKDSSGAYESVLGRFGNVGKESIFPQPVSTSNGPLSPPESCEAESVGASPSDTSDQYYSLFDSQAQANPNATTNRYHAGSLLSSFDSIQSISGACSSTLDTPEIASPPFRKLPSIDDLYREPTMILGRLCGNIPVYKYPYSERQISESLRSMLPDFTDTLWAQIDDNPQLAGHSTEIEVQLLMCTNRLDLQIRAAHPAVIITCQSSIADNLKNLLTSKAMRKYNLLWPTSLKRTFDTQSCRIYIESTMEPPSRNLGDYIDLCTLEGRVLRSIRTTMSDTYCGASIFAVDNRKLATIACVIKSGSGFLGLTAAHPFKDLLSRKLLTNCKDDGAAQQNVLGNINITPSDQQIRVIFPSKETDCTLRDYDWALILLPAVNPPRMNSFTFPYEQDEKVLLEAAVNCHPATERKVTILSSQGDKTKGTLLCGSVYRQLSPKARVAELWSVQLEKKDLIEGDSGSLVVDAETHEIYGYVISISHDRKVHIVPLFRAMEQIRRTLRFEHADLPSASDIDSIISESTQVVRASLQSKEHGNATSSMCEYTSKEVVFPNTSPYPGLVKEEPFSPAQHKKNLNDKNTENMYGISIHGEKEKEGLTAMHQSFQPLNISGNIYTEKKGLNELWAVYAKRLQEEMKSSVSGHSMTLPLVLDQDPLHEVIMTMDDETSDETDDSSNASVSSQSQQAKTKTQRFWYCCECNEGPKSMSYEKKCSGCGHSICYYCKLSSSESDDLEILTLLKNKGAVHVEELAPTVDRSLETKIGSLWVENQLSIKYSQ